MMILDLDDLTKRFEHQKKTALKDLASLLGLKVEDLSDEDIYNYLKGGKHE